MKKSTLKYVAVCAVALTAVTATTPAVTTILGEGTATVQAAVKTTVNFNTGAFTNEDEDLFDVAGVAPATNVSENTGLIGKVLEAGSTPKSLKELLGFEKSDNIKITIEGQDTTSITALDKIKAGTYNLIFTGTLSGETVAKESKTVSLTLKDYEVVATDISKNLADKYEEKVGITVKDADGNVVKDTKYAVAEAADSAFKAADSDNVDQGVFVKLQDAAVQTLKLTVTVDGKATDVKATRKVTVVATDGTKPSLYVDKKLAFIDGQEVPALYTASVGSTTYYQPTDKNAYLMNELFGGTASYKTPNAITLTAKGAYNDVTTNHFFKENMLDTLKDGSAKISVDASEVDFTKGGTYKFKLILTSSTGAKSTITVPLVVAEDPEAPVFIFENGITQDQTIKVGEGFDPRVNVTFYENKAGVVAGTTVDPARVKVETNINTNVAGTYTIKYTATNKIGKTISLTRTITVKDATDPVVTNVTAYRAYNPNNGEHLFTTSLAEYNNLTRIGWVGEGVGFTTLSSGTTIYRAYNPNSGEHLYTAEVAEYNNVVAAGWNGEGVKMYAATEATGTPVYRLFNPNAKNAGSHHYTTNAAERDYLVSLGWSFEKVAFYAAK